MISLTPGDALGRWLRTGELPSPASAEEAEDLVAEAVLQGVAALLDDAVRAEPAAPWPDRARERLRSAHRGALVLVLRRLSLASDLQALLEASGVPSIALKGAALADRLYASPAHRPMDDVDLLVLGHWPTACRAMEAAGYVSPIRGDHAWGFCLAREEMASRESGGSVPTFVELHAAPTSASGAFLIDGGGLRSRSQTIADPPRRVPSAEDLLLLTALHLAFQHGLAARLGQWLDLRRLAAQPDLNVPALLARAKKWGAAPALALALAAAEILVGGEVPWHERHELPRPLARRLGTLVPSSGLPLGLVRWHLAKGRRGALLLDTLAPRPLGGGTRPLGAIPRRLAGLLARAAFPR